MYAILTALESELECFIEKTSIKAIDIWNNYKFVVGVFAGQDCVIGYTGIGKVNASVVVSHIIEKYKPQSFFYTGIAGALRSDLNIGDVVIAGDSMQWDVNLTAFGFKIGELPSIVSPSGENKKTDNIRFYKTEQKLLEKALKWNPGGFKVTQGRIITGDSFFTTILRDYKADLIQELDCSAVDMEGAAAGAACKIYNTPFFLARVISDTTEGKTPKRFKVFMNDASRKMSELVEHILLT